MPTYNVKGTSVFIDIIGRDQASPAFMKAAATAETSGARMTRAFKTAIATAGKLGLAFGAYEVAKKALDIGKEAVQFQRSMTLIQTQAGASAQDVKTMSSAVLDMAGQVGTAPEELATSLYHVVSVLQEGGKKVNIAKALDITRVAAEGAKVGMADLEETTNALTSTVASGIKGADNMSQAMGALNAIVGAGDMKLADLNEALGSGILTTAASFNVNLTQVGAALATFGDNNIRGADAATRLRMAIMDLAHPAANADQWLGKIGLTSQNLQKDLQKGGLTQAITDLHDHLRAAGITAKNTGTFMVNTFTKRSGAGLTILVNQIDRYRTKLDAVAHGAKIFGANWQATQQTAGFVFDKLGAEATALGIKLADQLLPPITEFAAKLAKDIPGAVRTAQAILTPFAHFVGTVLGGAWTVVSDAIGLVAAALKPVISLLSALKTPLGFAAAGAAAVYAGFKLFSAIPGLIEVAYLKVLYMQDAVVGIGTKAKNAATTFTASVTSMSTAASVSSEEIAASGAAARVGWAGLLGPIGAVALGIASVVMMFHKSKSASKDATDSIRGFADALKTGSRADLVGEIVKQLSDKDVSKKIADLKGQIQSLGQVQLSPLSNVVGDNTVLDVRAVQQALNGAKITGSQFINALANGPKAVDALRQRLVQVQIAAAEAAKHTVPDSADWQKANATYQTATGLIQILTDKSNYLGAAQKKEIANFKAFGQAVTPLQNVAATTKVATDQAAKYAQMAGFVVTKNNDVVGSAKDVNSSIKLMSGAYDNATSSAQGLLDAVGTFSGSAGTAADRAALIGATLKAANGDALSFAGTMAQTAGAVDSLTGAFKQQHDQLVQQSTDQQKAAAGVNSAQTGLTAAQQRVAAAQQRVNELRGKASTKASTLKSAEAALTSAQKSATDATTRLANARADANKQDALAYKDTERAAIRFRTVHGKLMADIRTNAKGAGDLVSQLQGIQDAAMGAASATFQHEKATKGATKAADDAYQVYVTKTKGSLIDSAQQLGLTQKQAEALADQYFGMPKNVKTAIEQEGANPVVNVLKQIRGLLADLTGTPWNIRVKRTIDTHWNPVTGLNRAGLSARGAYLVGMRQHGGPVSAGQPYIVGERRPELFVPKQDGRIVPSVPTGNKIVVEKQELHVHYPLEGGLGEALPQLMRMSAQKLGELV